MSLLSLLLPVLTALAQSGSCVPPVTNPIACENSKPGNPSSEWDVDGAGDASIQGFATDISVDQGQTVSFKVKTDASDYRFDIYRLGYYGGMGARKVATVQPSAGLPQSQPVCLTDGSTGLIDCGNWAQSASWAVPPDAVSGIYLARLVREDPPNAGQASHIVFVVRDDDGRSDIMFQTSDTTWQAYNSYGGNSLYTGAPVGRAYKVSYNRPFNTRADNDFNWLFNAEYPMVRWLESNGYDVSYSTGLDSERRGSELLEHKVFIAVGHDEYWSGGQLANVEAARSAGVNLAFFSGNDVFWKTRWENSIDSSGTPYRTLVCYKETQARAKIDPNSAWTGTWRDPSLSPPADGGRPENGLTGTLYRVNYPRNDAITVPGTFTRMRFWRNTSIASLAPNATATLPEGTLGHEWNEDVDNSFRPAGLIRLSSTTLDVSPNLLLDYGATYGSGTATHNMTLYRHASGALVFSSGTIQWSWGLDSNHDRLGPSTDTRMQQATVNLFADMGVQPGTLQAGLTAASASTDQTRPSSTVSAPPTGSLVQGVPATITGTAADTGSGVVGGVEVSVDGGTTWRRANGLESWSYTWTPPAPGSATIRSRAVDDSGNLEVPGAGFTVSISPRTCPCSIWDNSANPAQEAYPDGQPIEVGVRIRSDIDGYVSGVRFYKGAGNSGTHVGHLWTSGGQLLATATFANETASGWQQASFPAPVAISANTTYVVSYFAPNGHYALDSDFFAAAGVDNYPLNALRDGVDGPNGVFKTGVSGFPTQTHRDSNYWVDVVFATAATDTIAPTIVGQAPTPGASKVSMLANATATFSEPVSPASIVFVLRDPGGAPVPAAVTYDATSRTATLDPNAALAESTTYTATVSGALDQAGNVMSPTTWSFISSGSGTSIWDDTATPAIASYADAQPIEVGVKIRSDVDGYITSIRFYKGAGNTGPHVGHLWTSGGQLLATVTFANETAGGWQQAVLPAPTPISANTTYVVSYFAPNGQFALDSGYFGATGVDTMPLHALRSGVDGPNGVYKIGSSGFPTDSYGASNYWVDIVFATTATDTIAPTLVGQTPVPGSNRASLATNVTAMFSEPVSQGSISFTLRNPSGVTVPAAVTYDASSRTVTLDPNAALVESTTYTATVSGATDQAGNAMSPTTWSFITSGPATSIWDDSATPGMPAYPDGQPIEVGVKVRSDVSGYVTGVRFYKGAGNTGTHVGHLWTSGGQLLATATFANETATGWQQASFAAPVAVSANTTYVVSYFAPNGHFALNNDFFATTGVDIYPLHALRDGVDGPNGVFKTGASGFPTETYRASNYWVDVVFAVTATDTVAPTLVGQTPAVSAGGISPLANVAATFSEPVSPASILFTLRNPSGATVPATVTYDASTYTATLDPNAALAESTTYTVTVSGAADSAGNAMSPATWSFTTAAASASIWSPTATPGTPAYPDGQPIEVGVKVRSDISGYVTGVRFYKGVGNTGAHVGHLWTSGGQLLATATFANETASGWQQASFPAPVAISANTTYVVSYFAPNGQFALDSGYFGATGADAYPLHALRSGVDGSNGVYRAGSSGFPTDSYGASNYWVDIVFTSIGP